LYYFSGDTLGNAVTISAKIPKELKEKLHRMGVNVSRLIRNALEEEVKRREEAQLREDASEVSQILKNVPEEEIVKLVRETRDER
jgi:post-segregation antitoxin (ccd killing protein)